MQLIFYYRSPMKSRLCTVPFFRITAAVSCSGIAGNKANFPICFICLGVNAILLFFRPGVISNIAGSNHLLSPPVRERFKSCTAGTVISSLLKISSGRHNCHHQNHRHLRRKNRPRRRNLRMICFQPLLPFSLPPGLNA